MASLQLKGIDDALYSQIKELAASENRSVSQQVLFLVSRYIANKKQFQKTKSPSQVLLELSESWEDSRSAREFDSEIKRARKNFARFKAGSTFSGSRASNWRTGHNPTAFVTERQGNHE